MLTTDLNIKIDKEVKEQAEVIFSELGFSMSQAINMFLKSAIRANGMPFELKLDVPNSTTQSAIEEGKKIADDGTAKGYSNIEDLRKALQI